MASSSTESTPADRVLVQAPRAVRIQRGVASAWVLLLVELVAVSVAQRRELTGIWEIRNGALLLAPLALLLAGALGALGVLFLELVERWRVPRLRVALALLVGVFGVVVGYGVGGGRHLADLGRRGGFALLVGLGVGALAYLLAPGFTRLKERAPEAVALGLGLLVVLLELANHWVLPRLYPAFHGALSVLALLIAAMPSACFGVVPGSQQQKKKRPYLLVAWLGGGLVLGALSFPAARRLALFDNFRFVFVEHAPILGRAVELAARLAPPVPHEGDADAVDVTASTPSADGKRALELSGRDLVLITIDALRADHLGAYGYERPTSPNLDRLAQEGVVFERAYTSTPHTSYAVVSLMTGKYMRPLLLQGAGSDSDTWASLLRRYGYRTAGFYPPAVFFIDTPRFEPFQRSTLGFEYVKVEFAEGKARVRQVSDYLAGLKPEQRVFTWVHLFSPHEPYVAHPEHAFGERDLDRYDSEIAAADATVGELVQLFRARRPNTVFIVTADHGEEFGEHGGRYHGTTVYEEQLRVPLIFSAPELLVPRRVSEVVSNIDVLPTVLGGLAIPRPPRLRGRDLGALLAGKRSATPGLVHGETDELSLYGEGDLRLICARRIGACKLYDLALDPRQEKDVAGTRAEDFERLRKALRALSASHGRYESQGLRAEGKALPEAIVRALAGDGDVAPEVAALLDDVDPLIRRKAAEVLSELRRPETAPALRLALSRDEDSDVRKLAALALTRLGEAAALVFELLNDTRYRRLAALALAESGDARGQEVLIEWWRDRASRDFSRSKQLLEAFAKLKSREAVPVLAAELEDVRLRPELASALARIGDERALKPLVEAFERERLQSTRVALARAIWELGGREELVKGLVRFLGVPDPLPDGLLTAMNARVLPQVGGPSLQEPTLEGFAVHRTRVLVPKGGNGRGVRALVRAECAEGTPSSELVLGSAGDLKGYDKAGQLTPERKLPELDEGRSLRFQVPCRGTPVELFATLPDTIRAKPGAAVELAIVVSRPLSLHGFALVPLADELPPPEPKPWRPEPNVELRPSNAP